MSWIALLLVVAAAFAAGMLYGVRRRSRDPEPAADLESTTAAPTAAASDVAISAPDSTGESPIVAERARLLRSYEAEAARLRGACRSRDAAIVHLEDLAADRRRLFDGVAAARAETARYRQLCVDLEDNALPPILDAPGAPDDLKLIVGVGPVLERMLHQLGVTTYRQIARWSERDIDDFDARLSEFPGRIRRDAWVTQARELHQGKYGERP